MASNRTPRLIKVAAAQLGPNNKDATREEILARLLKHMDAAAAQGVRLIAFPELALTTFFPVMLLQSADAYFEPASTSHPYNVLDTPHGRPLVEKANALGLDFYLGYAERWTDAERGTSTDYNTTLYYSAAAGRAVAKYRKVHLPGTVEPLPDPTAYQQLEKRYFAPGDLGFRAFRAAGLVSGALKAEDVTGSDGDSTEGKGDPILGMLICNDRRWPEAWRAYGLQGVELVIEGYNTTAWAPQYAGAPEEQTADAEFHHRLSCQAGSYQNACWSINVAKCGCENGQWMIGGSMIIDPNGKVVAESKTLDDELVVATIDLGLCRKGKERVFNFGKHRRLDQYGIILEQVGTEEIPLLSRSGA
ncbi:carbon-nitrogen hydrolase [Camillea tinctor]|nr:carbon-nitrogen hydrolase [Camillea tinctor]